MHVYKFVNYIKSRFVSTEAFKNQSSFAPTLSHRRLQPYSIIRYRHNIMRFNSL